MSNRFSFDIEIPPSRKVVVNLPNDVPLGPATVEVTVSPTSGKKGTTLKDFLNPEFFGIWKDRDDISDSTTFARALRDKAWKRQ